ncbi:cobalamin biosynthesis protein CbiX [Rhodocyclus tenuis]|uniref:sirohydrochlorin chelatase n=1 Tax=Rhodocyclus gracilis TaxID=2929842 RepID=UPI001298ABA3|nr:CbiX/SirB N-terminal domain-containing protein [Rhodocyclus gracilis]MRD73708.1 cobalamin biosynthesis protein CbiX [Rhodocyclus gracilis]
MSPSADAPTLILFAHGARDPQWDAPLHRIAAAIRERSPGQQVTMAFLGLRAPTLDTCVETLVADGHRSLLIVPIFVANSGHLIREMPPLIDALQTRFPQVQIALADAVGEAEPVVQAIATHALSLLLTSETTLANDSLGP